VGGGGSSMVKSREWGNQEQKQAWKRRAVEGRKGRRREQSFHNVMHSNLKTKQRSNYYAKKESWRHRNQSQGASLWQEMVRTHQL